MAERATVTKLPSARASAPTTPRARDDSHPEPPDWLSPSGRAIWRKLVAQAEVAAPAWLKSVDSIQLAFAVEHAAIAVAALRSMRGPGGRYKILEVDTGHQGRIAKHPAAQVFRDNADAFMRIMTAMGLPARERARLKLAELDEDDEDDAAWS